MTRKLEDLSVCRLFFNLSIIKFLGLNSKNTSKIISFHVNLKNGR